MHLELNLQQSLLLGIVQVAQIEKREREGERERASARAPKSTCNEKFKGEGTNRAISKGQKEGDSDCSTAC